MHHPKRDAQGEDLDLENTNHMCIQKENQYIHYKNENEKNYSFVLKEDYVSLITCQQNMIHSITSPVTR